MQLRIHLISDLHDGESAKAWADGYIPPQADVRVIAGDLASYERRKKCWKLLKPLQDGTPILLVLGNHDHWGRGAGNDSMQSRIASWRSLAADHGVTLLACDRVVLHGIPFIGTTWWSGMDWFPTSAPGVSSFMDPLQLVLPHIDGRKSLVRDWDRIRNWSIDQHRSHHAKETAWIASHLDDRPIVITHFAPLKRCVPQRFERDGASPYYANHRPDLVAQSRAWLYGHIHDGITFPYQGSIVANNASGYWQEDHNNGYDPSGLIEVTV